MPPRGNDVRFRGAFRLVHRWVPRRGNDVQSYGAFRPVLAVAIPERGGDAEIDELQHTDGCQNGVELNQSSFAINQTYSI